jgi:alanyl-tRNA synthetase
MTERLYYTDSYLTEFRALVVDRSPDGGRVYLDRTAFYPTSGGQPFDTGTISGASVTGVVEEGDRIAHVVGGSVAADEVECRIDWPRRFDHMQQHTGQHLLSAVAADLFGWATLSVHFGAESSTVDLDTPSLTGEQARAAERRANEIVFENRPVSVSFAAGSEDLGLRKVSERAGVLRVISIEGVDRSACGGTHVRSTGEIGPVLIRKLDKVRGAVRVEFLCGHRALGRARADFDTLSKIAQSFSAPLDETPDLVAARMEALKTAEKERRRLEEELGVRMGRELYAATPPDPRGERRVIERAGTGSLDSFRAMAQGFCAGVRAVFVGVVEQPPAILLASSVDSGLDAGKLLKAALQQYGGRGGGAPRMAQGSIPSRDALEQVVALLTIPSASPPD